MDRINYYLGDFKNKKNIFVKISNYLEFKQNRIYFYKGNKNYPSNFRFENGHVHPGWWWGANNGFIVNFQCLTNSADGYESDKLPVLTKARKIGDEYNGILLKYEYHYHWDVLENFKDSTNYNNKINDLVWRGNCITSLEKKNNRRTFFEKYNYSLKYNVGFVKHTDEPFEYYTEHKNFFKDKMSVDDQTKYKYILCLEGNDVATSLKWSLMTNSIVIMSKPIIESWLMEGLLQPYIHYVPLKDDFSDLDEIIEWCRNNDKKCEEISKNSTQFMKQFMNPKIELKIHNYLINWYKSNVILR